VSLPELLVGLLLASLASAGALTAYAQGRERYETSQAVSRLQERAAYVFSTLEPELQLAGYYGVHGAALLPTLAAPASAEHCGAGHATRLGAVVEASDGYALACAPQAPGVVPGTAVLTVRRASAQPAVPDAGRLQLLTSLDDARGRTLIANGAVPNGLRLAPGITELRDLVVRSWYVARASDGDGAEPALRVKSLTRVAGQPRFVDTEVMPGIEGLDVALGVRDLAAVAEGGIRYVPAGAPLSGAPVVTVRVTLRLRATESARTLRHLAVTRTFALRNAAAA
jgi:hypothetical protein